MRALEFPINLKPIKILPHSLLSSSNNPNSMRNVLAAFLCVLSLVQLAGCGGVADAPKLGKVAGTVMVDGKPQAGLTVEFHPDSKAGTTGPMSMGVTNDEGDFILSSATGRAGAVIGNHKVVVKCPWTLGGRAGAANTADGFGSSPTGELPPPPADDAGDCTLNIRFEDPDTTTLSAAVPEEGVADLLLQVTTK